MAAHLLILDDQQSEQLRREADDRNLTISAYIERILVECEIIPSRQPTPAELVDLAVDIACGAHEVRDRARVQGWLRAEQDRLRSALLAVSTGLEAIEEVVEPATPPTTTPEPIWVEDEEVDEAALLAQINAIAARLPSSWVEEDDDEGEQEVEQEESAQPEPEQDVDAVHWLDSWLPSIADCTPPVRRRKPGGPPVLDVLDVRAIRRALASGRLTQREIATAYGCSRSNISKVKNGRSWVGVHDDD